MQANNEQNLSYEMIEACFLEEAASLLSDAQIQKTLQTEQLRFENAGLSGISPSRFIGSNTVRYCKDLLRKNQPFSFLYTLLSFLSEVSVLLLLFGLLRSIGNLLFTKAGFLSSFPYLYECILLGGITAGITLFRKQCQTVLAIPFASAAPSDLERRQRKKTLLKRQLLILLPVIVIVAGAIAWVAALKLHKQYKINLTGCFFVYVICMLLSGIHNVIYSSHLIPFLTIGGYRLLCRSKDMIQTAIQTYLDASYLQILSRAHKTLEDSRKNPELAGRLKQSVYARMVTTRIYCALALFLLVILDIMCILQLQGVLTLAFLVFFAICLLLTFAFLIAVLSANTLLKQTKES